MRGIFILLALISGILGIVILMENPLDPTTGLSGIMLLLNSAGWATVAKLSDKVEKLG